MGENNVKKDNSKKNKFWFLVLCFFIPPVGIAHCIKTGVNVGDEDTERMKNFETCLNISLSGLMLWFIFLAFIFRDSLLDITKPFMPPPSCPPTIGWE
jgi:hypothetical protein